MVKTNMLLESIERQALENIIQYLYFQFFK